MKQLGEVLGWVIILSLAIITLCVVFIGRILSFKMK